MVVRASSAFKNDATTAERLGVKAREEEAGGRRGAVVVLKEDGCEIGLTRGGREGGR